MSHFERIGVLGHPRRQQTEPVTERIAKDLVARGINTWFRHQWTADDVQEAIMHSDLIIAIGGDGAMFRAARVCAPYDVPVLGLNMGRLGFLTEIQTPDDWNTICDRLLRHDYWIETRMMIRAQIQRDGVTIAEDSALNDVVISAHHAGTMIQVDCYIDGHWTTTYSSDALIVATPTGSTAYALAAGGPILPPDLSNILIVPTAAHLSLERPIVLSEGSQVAVRASVDNRVALLATSDGIQLAELGENDILYITACDFSSRFIRFRERNYFYRSLLDRLEPRVNRTAPQQTLKTSKLEDA